MNYKTSIVPNCATSKNSIKDISLSNKPSLFNNGETKLLTVDMYKDLGIYLLLFAMPFLALFYRKGFFVFI